MVMDTTCPYCKEIFNVGEEDHYKSVQCPKCEREFQAFSDTTQKLTRDFLDQLVQRDDSES